VQDTSSPLRGKRHISANVLITQQQDRLRSFHARYLSRTVNDPTIRERLTPQYPYGCKRPVFTSDFYPTFNTGNVRLVARAAAKLSADGLVAEDGVERKTEIVIPATGFRASEYLAKVDVTEQGGASLKSAWGDAPYAFLGMTVPSFPNFFLLYGTDTNGGGSICAQLERQSEVVTRMARRLARRGEGATVQTRPRIARQYDSWVQRAIKTRRNAFESGCHNYYYSLSGENVTEWPYGHSIYALATRILPEVGFKTHTDNRRYGLLPCRPAEGQ
jgi:cation diffusion facilitator CzcD-associated flavoprotein CzcO